MLTEVVKVNGSLRPAVWPWAQTALEPETESVVLAPDQEALADQVLARVQQKLAPLLPELMREAVDEVLREHLSQSHPVMNSNKD